MTSDDLPKLYMLTGHGESALSTSFQTAVEKQNVETEELSLLTVEGVPKDADALFINAPTSDISEAERDAILEYLQSGGRLILITGPLQDGTELTNLEAVMEYYGVSAVDGIVVEGSQSNYIFPSPVNLLPEYGSHEITSPLSSGGYYMCLPLAQGLAVSDTGRDTVSVTQLLTTSDDAFSKLSGYSMSTYEFEDGDIEGPFALAVAVTETLDDDMSMESLPDMSDLVSLRVERPSGTLVIDYLEDSGLAYTDRYSYFAEDGEDYVTLGSEPAYNFIY